MKIMEEDKKLLKNAYNICERAFGEIPLKLNKIILYKYNSRKEFDKIWKKSYKKNSNREEVGFVTCSALYKRILFGRKFEIHILSKQAFNRESDFDRSYFFKVLIHEISHIFLYYTNTLKSLGELICYYVAKQNKFHKKEYLLGEKLMKLTKK